jgi:hypothetical protein
MLLVYRIFSFIYITTKPHIIYKMTLFNSHILIFRRPLTLLHKGFTLLVSQTFVLCSYQNLVRILCWRLKYRVYGTPILVRLSWDPNTYFSPHLLFTHKTPFQHLPLSPLSLPFYYSPHHWTTSLRYSTLFSFIKYNLYVRYGHSYNGM